MKKTLLILSIFSFLFAGCTLTIGGGCQCGENCCSKPAQVQVIEKEIPVEETSDFPSDEFVVIEDTTENF
jgi:hypothetical protein